MKLIASADAQPDQLYQRGEGAKAFERTASRLEEMQSQEWLGPAASALGISRHAASHPLVIIPVIG